MTDRVDDNYVSTRNDVNVMATPAWGAIKEAGRDPGAELLGRPYYTSIEDRHEPGILKRTGIRLDGGEELLNSEEVDNADIIDPGFGVGMEPGQSSDQQQAVPQSKPGEAVPAPSNMPPRPPMYSDQTNLARAGYPTGLEKDDPELRAEMLADLLHTASAVPKAIVRGGADTINSNLTLLEDTINFFAENKVTLARLPKIEISGDNAALNILSGLTQFLVPFGALGKLGNAIRVVRTLKKSGAIGAISESMLRGALVDFSAFDPKLGNLSTWIQTTPARNAINEFLTHDAKSEEWLLGRLKNTVEGAALGGFIEVFVRGGLRVVKLMKQTRDHLRGISDARMGASDTPADFKSSSNASGDINMVP